MIDADQMVPRGLPDRLPAGERILWQGAPRTWRVLRDVFHARLLASYFGVLVAWRLVGALYDGASAVAAATAAAGLLPLVALALGLVWLLAGLVARTSVYTLTDRRIMMRIGIALPMTLNLPLRLLDSASLRRRPDGSGDVCFGLAPGNRIGYLHLWPHARPWRYARPEPAMRCVDDVEALGRRIAAALEAAPGPVDDAAVVDQGAGSTREPPRLAAAG